MTSYKLERGIHGTPFYSPSDSLYDQREDVYCLGRSVLRLLLGPQEWTKLKHYDFVIVSEKIKSRVSAACLEFL